MTTPTLRTIAFVAAAALLVGGASGATAGFLAAGMTGGGTTVGLASESLQLGTGQTSSVGTAALVASFPETSQTAPGGSGLRLTFSPATVGALPVTPAGDSDAPTGFTVTETGVYRVSAELQVYTGEQATLSNLAIKLTTAGGDRAMPFPPASTLRGFRGGDFLLHSVTGVRQLEAGTTVGATLSVNGSTSFMVDAGYLTIERVG